MKTKLDGLTNFVYLISYYHIQSNLSIVKLKKIKASATIKIVPIYYMSLKTAITIY